MTDKPAPTNQPDTDNHDHPADDPADSSAPAASGDDFGVESALAALNALAQEPDVDQADDPDDDAVSVPSYTDDDTEAADDTAPATDIVTEAAVDDPISDDDDTAAEETDAVAAPVASSAPPHNRVSLPDMASGTKLYRGQAASVIPALLLILSGAVLLFLVTTSDVALTLPVSVALASAAAGIMLLAHWFSAERRATGNFFIGLTLLLGGGLGMYALQSGVTLQTAWPLFLVVPGGTLLATALISHDDLRHAALIGLLLLVAGAGSFVLLEFVL